MVFEQFFVMLRSRWSRNYLFIINHKYLPYGTVGTYLVFNILKSDWRLPGWIKNNFYHH